MDRVRKVLATTFRINISDINEITTMEEIDTWDSLIHMEMIVNLEREFNLEFEGEEIAEMVNVGVIEKIIGAKINGNKE